MESHSSAAVLCSPDLLHSAHSKAKAEAEIEMFRLQLYPEMPQLSLTRLPRPPRVPRWTTLGCHAELDRHHRHYELLAGTGLLRSGNHVAGHPAKPSSRHC